MLIVVAYDVNTVEESGAKRLRKVAKLCERHGMRVQNSVFEVLVNAAQFVTLKAELERIINPKEDSIRFYKLGNSYEHKIETLGKVPMVQAGGAFIL